MSTPELTPEVVEACKLGRQEGWDLFWHDEMEWQLQYDQDQAVLIGDDAAWTFVVRAAAAGTPHCRTVLRFLQKHSPVEYKHITEYVLLGIVPVY